MKLYVLMENTTSIPKLTAEHGLSLFAETEQHQFLFDAGQTGAFAENAEKLGVDLTAADLAVLSHGHYDHGGGLDRFLELNEHAPVYLSRYAFEPHFNGNEKNIGLDASLKEQKRLIYLEDEYRIDEELSVYSCNQMEKTVPSNSFGLNMQMGDALAPDDFRHEQYLLVQEGNKKILFSGCSHKGILNIVDWFRPDILIGGFHFMKLEPDDPSDREQLEQAAYKLLQYPTRYFTGHCTGTAQYQFLKTIMGERLEYLSTGQMVVL